MKTNLIGYLFIAIAGFFWATLGIFTNGLYAVGLTSPQIAFMRMLFGAFFVFLYCLIFDRPALQITRKGLIRCLFLGLICQAVFNLCYVNAIGNVGVSVAAVLLYTSPIFMAIFSMIFYRETMTKYKVISIIITVAGAFLAATGGTLQSDTLNGIGILSGLAAALCYASMPFISKGALDENKNVTIILYSFLFAAIFLLPVAGPAAIINSLTNWRIMFNIIGLGLFPSCLAFLFFYAGINRNIKFSIVGIISSTELIFSQIFGWVLFGEIFTLLRLTGIVLMFGSAFLVLYEAGQKKA